MIEFFVPGVPAPGGSKKAFVVSGRAVVTEDAKQNANWRAAVALAAAGAMGGRPPLAGPLLLTLRFYVARPRGHYGHGRNARAVRPSAPAYPAVRPDLTKLIRSVEDALTGICWNDDAQVVGQTATKAYYDLAGVEIAVEVAGEGRLERGANGC